MGWEFVNKEFNWNITTAETQTNFALFEIWPNIVCVVVSRALSGQNWPNESSHAPFLLLKSQRENLERYLYY